MNENEIGTRIVESAIRLHQDLGPGLFESVYEIILTKILERQGFSVERQVNIPIQYEGIRFEAGFRADMVVDDKVIIELKAVERITNAHKKQLLTYLRLTNMKLGYLLNFSEALMKRGITRTINGQIDD